MITNKVLKTILENDLIHKGEHIVVGLSGGPDSVCLFYLLHHLEAHLGIHLHAVHVNHKFRPGAAEEDQAYVEEFCRRLNVPCHTFVCDCLKRAVEEGVSPEEAGRNARYEAFYKVAEKLGKPNEVAIAVAHHADDQAETVLIRLLRGTGTDGLSGMEYKRKGQGGYPVVRPLLDVSRKEVEAYCADKKLEPRRDLTNLEPLYIRNKIRLELIPYLQENFNQNITESLLRLSKIAREDKTCLWEEAERRFKEAALARRDGAVELALPVLQEAPPALRHRMILRAMEEIGLAKDISAAHMAAADRLILEGKPSSATDFPKGYRLSVSYEKARFQRKGGPLCKEKDFLMAKQVLLRDEWIARRLTGDGQLKNVTGTAWVAFDYDQLAGLPPPEIRVRREGDFIRPSGMMGTKKLQDFFVDKKVPKEKRDQVPLIAIGSEILWIVGDDVTGKMTGLLKGRISGNYLISKETERILLLELHSEL